MSLKHIAMLHYCIKRTYIVYWKNYMGINIYSLLDFLKKEKLEKKIEVKK
jgi:hypothetical protein